MDRITRVSVAIIFFMMAVLICLAPDHVNAQASGQQEEKVAVPKSMLTSEQLQNIHAENLNQRIQTYGKWVGLGKEVGDAFNGAFSAFTDQTVRLSETKVGKFTMFIIAYKVLGRDLIQAIVGIPFFLLGIVVWIWIFWKNCVRRRVLVKINADKSKEYEVINDVSPEDGDAYYAKWGYIAVLLVFIGICSIMIFA